MVSRRSKGWLLLVGVAVLGAAVGILAGYLLADSVAGAVTGVVTAVLGVLGARGRALVDRGAEVRTALKDQVIGGRPRRVQELDDPVLLGVHPAARDEAGQVPAYVSRDADDRVDEALRAGGFVLLSGESTAGKTRVAYEAVRRVLPDHHLVAPASRESVQTVVETVVDRRRCVVWLDDVDRYFGAHGLTVPLLDRMLAADAVVLGTIRVAELDKFGARHETGLARDERDAWRAAREVLRLAVEIPLSRRWSAPELDRASRSADRRVRSALRMTDTFGLAELLADGPELARDWEHAWRPGGQPRGAALVAAGVDCRRAGLADPVPVELLAELAEHYLDARGGVALRPEPLADAVAWATKPARGASSLLLPAGEDRVLAFDYLIDLVSEPVPVPVWLRLIEWCSPEQALGVGLNARRVSRFEAAEAAFEKAGDLPGAKAALAELIGSGEEPERAVALLTDALAGMSPDDPETLLLRNTLARFTHEIDAEAATRMFAELLDDCLERLGPDHPDVLEVRLQAAIQLGKSRAHDEAVRRLAELVDDYTRVLGPDDHDTLRVRQQHAAWTGRRGERDRALELFTELLADRLRVQGPDHPNVLSNRFAIAAWSHNSGDPARAVELFAELLPDSIRVLGEHHPHTVSARYRLGLCAGDAGRLDLAAEQLGIVREAWTNRFGPDSDRVKRVEWRIASLTQ